MSERIAIVGAGVMGRNHARTIAEEVANAELVAVSDPDTTRADMIVTQYGAEHATVRSLYEIDNTIADIAVIASPSEYHVEQAARLMESGVHVLIEKPVAKTPEEIEELSNIARSYGRVAMAGHIELFNPTVNTFMSLLLNGNTKLRELDFARLGTVPPESRLYHGAVSDLMTHDISIALQLIDRMGGSIDKAIVETALGRKDTIAAPDPARASISFDDIDTHFRVSRAYGAGKVRRIIAETDGSVIRADLLTRVIAVNTAAAPVPIPDGISEDTRTTHFYPRATEQPLAREMIHMIESVKGETTPAEAGVSLEQALRVVKLVQRVEELIASSRV